MQRRNRSFDKTVARLTRPVQLLPLRQVAPAFHDPLRRQAGISYLECGLTRRSGDVGSPSSLYAFVVGAYSIISRFASQRQQDRRHPHTLETRIVA